MRSSLLSSRALWAAGRAFSQALPMGTYSNRLRSLRDHEDTAQDIVEAFLAEQDPEQIARAFHDAYEELAPEFGYDTRLDSRVPWEDVPRNNRELMIATVRRVLGQE